MLTTAGKLASARARLRRIEAQKTPTAQEKRELPGVKKQVEAELDTVRHQIESFNQKKLGVT